MVKIILHGFHCNNSGCGGFSWIPVRRAVRKVYARGILVDPGPDPLDA